jgi:hypothetical protein
MPVAKLENDSCTILRQSQRNADQLIAVPCSRHAHLASVVWPPVLEIIVRYGIIS